MVIVCHPARSQRTPVSLSHRAECWEHDPSPVPASCQRAAAEVRPPHAITRSSMVPGEGFLSSPAMLRPVSHGGPAACRGFTCGQMWGCLLIAEVFDWALCLFEEESQLLSYFESFAGVLITTLDNSEHWQSVCCNFPTIRRKAARHSTGFCYWVEDLGQNKAYRGLEGLEPPHFPKPSSTHVLNWDFFTTDLGRKSTCFCSCQPWCICLFIPVKAKTQIVNPKLLLTSLASSSRKMGS